MHRMMESGEYKTNRNHVSKVQQIDDIFRVNVQFVRAAVCYYLYHYNIQNNYGGF
jgi:hypothetical protein